MKTKRLLLVLSVFIGAVFTARWWLPALLTLLSVNGDLIQALDSTISLISNAVTLISALGGYLLLRDQQSDNKIETLEQRNRRILLGHVENAWIKGVLDASLHGTALLDLGIKQDPEAVTKYPWALKKESTNETLPAGTSMLEIFDSIGMGRSLLILGAPGSGKTTMLLKLARGLIARAREDVTQPIPMVFNLASWTEKQALADWLAQELNNLYSVPRKTAPDWVKGNKLMLLLDGLDEVRQDSRTKCVEAINAFRKEHGMTSLAVCSRSQDYVDLNAKLSFEGAIEVQPLTQEQIAEFFNRFGDKMAGIKQVLKKDSALHEMAETPLFLSIMIMAYRDKQDVDILVTQDEKAQRKHLFDTYIERMFERQRSKKVNFQKQDMLHWLSGLAWHMIDKNHTPYMPERMRSNWIDRKKRFFLFRLIVGLIAGLSGCFLGLLVGALFKVLIDESFNVLLGALIGGVLFELFFLPDETDTFDANNLEAQEFRGFWINLVFTLGRFMGLLAGLIAGLIFEFNAALSPRLSVFGFVTLLYGLFYGSSSDFSYGVSNLFFHDWIGRWVFGRSEFHKNKAIISNRTFRISGFANTNKKFNGNRFLSVPFDLSFLLLVGLFYGLFIGLIIKVISELFTTPFTETISTIFILGMMVLGGFRISYYICEFFIIFKHYTLRLILNINDLLPWRLVPFLDHCVDLIFLRRVGGGYIFVHRLLMEHFAEMYVESTTSKGNQKS